MCTFDESINNLINSISDSTREANESMTGYYYQIDQTLYSTLNSSDNKKYRLEKIEDYIEFYEDENTNSKHMKAVQVKYHNSRVTDSKVYKPLLYGYISYHTYIASGTDINFQMDLLIGTEQAIV
jgi:hypothetical protein